MILDQTRRRGGKPQFREVREELPPKHHSLGQGQGFFIVDHREVSPTPVLLGRVYVRREPRGALLPSDADTLCELVDLVRRGEEKEVVRNRRL